jgi:hypothetical protein
MSCLNGRKPCGSIVDCFGIRGLTIRTAFAPSPASAACADDAAFISSFPRADALARRAQAEQAARAGAGAPKPTMEAS